MRASLLPQGRHFGAALAVAVMALAGAVGSAGAAPAREKPGAGVDFSEARLNELMERDRPRSLWTGLDSDAKFIKDADRALVRLQALAGQYSAQRKVTQHRQILDLVNRFGLRSAMSSESITRLAFQTLHEAGPPLDDPENGGNAAFADLRHYRYLRLLSLHVWKGWFTTDPLRRMAARYMLECELKPSRARPSGNAHDPSCGYLFEAGFPTGGSVGDVFDPAKAYSLQDYAEGKLGNYQIPRIDAVMEYPLHLAAGDPRRRYLWIGDTVTLQRIYDQDRFTSLAYRTRLSAAAKAEEARRRQKLAAETEMRAADRVRWEELWSRSDLSLTEQTELEQLSFSLYEMPRYMGRFRLLSYEYIRHYCVLGFTDQCARQTQLESASRTPSYGTWAPSNQVVTVRSYDAYGNYTGSSATTRVDATLMGARPQ